MLEVFDFFEFEGIFFSRTGLIVWLKSFSPFSIKGMRDLGRLSKDVCRDQLRLRRSTSENSTDRTMY